MFGANLPVGCFIHIEKPHLQAILDQLRALGYRVIGPTVADGAIVFQEIDTVSEMPIGYVDQPGAPPPTVSNETPKAPTSTTSSAPTPSKTNSFLLASPSSNSRKTATAGRASSPSRLRDPLAVIGVRPCDLHALKMQDRIFLADRYPNPDYEARRKNLFIVAVNCGRPASTCFCTSMETGPAASEGFDLAITELPRPLRDRNRHRTRRQGRLRRALDSLLQPRRLRSAAGHPPRGTRDGTTPLQPRRRTRQAASSTPTASTTCCSITSNTTSGTRSPSAAWPAATARWSAPPASARPSRKSPT